MSIWDALVAIKTLDHLELEIVEDMITSAPVVLPTIRSLALTIYTDWNQAVSDNLVINIHGPSVNTLRLQCLPVDLAFDGSLKLCFPSMQHMILVNVERSTRINSIPMFARVFPAITRLTYHFTHMNMAFLLVGDFLAAMVRHSIGLPDLCWPKLQTVAFSAFIPSWRDKGLHDAIRVLQEAGHPICKLMLPKRTLAKVKVEEITALEKVVEIEDYSLDWPSPFVDSF